MLFVLLCTFALTPPGESPVIDGHLNEAEWGTFDVQDVADGGAVKLRQDSQYLYIAIQSNIDTVSHVYLTDGKEIHVLHASASLGRAVYKPAGDHWQRTESFTWEVRDPAIRKRFNITQDHKEEQQQYLARYGWLAKTYMMGDKKAGEFQIAKSYLAGRRLAVSFNHKNSAGKPGIINYPEKASVAPADQEKKLLYGEAPEAVTFSTENWLDLSKQ